MPGGPEERLSQVWDLTQEVWLFFQGINAEQRLQRDVAVLVRRKTTISIEGIEVPVISLEDLIANKRASARTQDLADVEKLESVSPRKGKYS
jgi:hypothetical protein